MSLLSDFLQKPYAGLSRSGDTLTFSTGSARMILDSSDSTITGLGLPELILKTNYMAAGSGGWLRFRAPNSVGTLKDAASIRGSFSTTTDGAEDGSITVEVYVDGTPAQFRFDGNNKTFRPVGSVLMALGTSSARWDGAYLGDGTISGDVIPANGGFTIGSASSHSVFFKAGDVIRGWLDVAGRFSLGAAPSSATFLSLGGGNPSTLSSIYGFAALYDSPSTATVESTAFLASHKTVAASFTVAKHIGFRSADFTKGASSAITAQIGFQADDLTQGSQTYGFYSLVNTGSNRYGFYAAGTAANFLLGGLYIGTGTPPSTESLHVQSATITQGVAGFKQTNASATADIVTITGGANSSIYNAFKITDGTALKLTVRGDGVTFLGDSTTQRNGALFNVVGRTDLTPNQTHDLVTNTIAVTLYSGGSISVASAKQNNMVSLEPTVTLSGGSSVFHGIDINATLSSGTSGAEMRAINVAITTGSTAHLRAIVGSITETSTNSGTSAAVTAICTPYNTASGSRFALQTYLEGSGVANAHIQLASVAGCHANFGVQIDASAPIDIAAIYWKESSGTTASFLQQVDNSGSTKFKVDVDGRITSVAFNVQSNSDVTVGPAGATTGMTGGFPYIPAAAGVFSGTPTARSGFVPMVYDATNNKIMVYNSGWVKTAALT